MINTNFKRETDEGQPNSFVGFFFERKMKKIEILFF